MTVKQILVIDIGGISVKMSVSDQQGDEMQARRFPTPEKMTPQQLLEGVKETASDWQYEYISIGYPGPVKRNQPWREPVNLGTGWVDFDYSSAFCCPVRMINDAAMQALGSYRGKDMLFLGLGTGLGTALILDNHIVPMEVAHLPFKEGKNFEHVLGKNGLSESGQDTWFSSLLEAIDLFSYTFCTDYVVLGGGNANRLDENKLPENVFIGSNDNAFVGGIQLWD